MVSLNLLEGVTSLQKEKRKKIISKRFLIVTGTVFSSLFGVVFFLEVIFAAVGFGEGTLLFQEDTQVRRVSMDEFDVINRERAAAALVFTELIRQTPSGTIFETMRITNAKTLLAQGWIESPEAAEAFFARLRTEQSWRITVARVVPEIDSEKAAYKFVVKGDYLPRVKPDNAYKTIDEFPALDSLNGVVTQLEKMATEAGLAIEEAPSIQGNKDGTKLNEYYYAMKSNSSFKDLHLFLNQVYDSRLPVVFENVILRPEAGAIYSEYRMRVIVK